MAVTYGFEKMSILRLDADLKKATGAILTEIKGETGKGATSTFDLTGLRKDPKKVFGSNLAYFLLRKGYGDVAANFGILDVPYALDHEMAGHKKTTGGVHLLGEDTEPPYYAILIESEDYTTGEPVAFGIFAGTFGRDAYKAQTITDEDFNPEADDYVCTPVAKTLESVEKPQIVGFAYGAEELAELKTLLFGPAEG
ncbi:major tail protein [Enterococcus sp.]|uniref:major tail protein n=1 Tax=Enterococcus sp. TaxID=35783 RepID=UPI003C70DEC6